MIDTKKLASWWRYRGPSTRTRIALRRHLALHQDVLTEAEYCGVAAGAGILTALVTAMVTRRPLQALLAGLAAGPLAAEAVLYRQEDAYRAGLTRQAESMGRLLMVRSLSDERAGQ